MLTYYLDLARRSFKRNVSLTVLMIIMIAFGVGASMTTLTLLHVLSADPIPGKSTRLHYVQLDAHKAINFKPDSDMPEQITRLDAETLLRAGKADRQAIMIGGSAVVEPARADINPLSLQVRWTSSDFFAMFDVPFAAGGAWSAEDDTNLAHVAVITRKLAEQLYGSVMVLGQPIRVNGHELRIVGVIENWAPRPHFYDLSTGSYIDGDQLFAPFSTSRELKLSFMGSMNCWDDVKDPQALNAPCDWIQMWVELDSADKLSAYRDFLIGYAEQQLKVGRFERPPRVGLRNVPEWLAYRKVVPSDVRLQSWIALGFLLVCLVNTVGLLLTKFLRRAPELGVRRALGASKRAIFTQLLVEAGVVGLVGGAAGLGLAWLGLLAVRHQPNGYASLAHLDTPMLLATFALAVFATLLAGVLPAWRGCQLTPAIQLKSH